jgi:hypothetical protein
MAGINREDYESEEEWIDALEMRAFVKNMVNNRYFGDDEE